MISVLESAVVGPYTSVSRSVGLSLSAVMHKQVA